MCGQRKVRVQHESSSGDNQPGQTLRAHLGVAQLRTITADRVCSGAGWAEWGRENDAAAAGGRAARANRGFGAGLRLQALPARVGTDVQAEVDSIVTDIDASIREIRGIIFAADRGGAG